MDYLERTAAAEHWMRISGAHRRRLMQDIAFKPPWWNLLARRRWKDQCRLGLELCENAIRSLQQHDVRWARMESIRLYQMLELVGGMP